MVSSDKDFELFLERLAIALREMRSEKKYSQEELAQLSGVSRSRIAHVESGKHGSLSLNVLFKLTRACNITIQELFTSKFE